MIEKTQNDSTWKILIVDDEKEVHILTKTVLKGVRFEDKPLEFLSAYNAEDTHRVMAENDDIALILMDVVMERDNTGLELTRYIREDLGNRLTRIILRTGQPGEAPERRVIVEYEINDYKEKVDLTSNRLFTSVVKSLRNYRDLKQIGRLNLEINRSREGLGRVIEASSALFEVRHLNDFFDVLLRQAAWLTGFTGRLMIVDPDDGEVIRAIGEREPASGANDESPLNKILHRKSGDTEKVSRVEVGDDFLICRLDSLRGKGPVLVIDIKESPDQEELQILDIFTGNANIVFNNISLEEDSHATQTEMLGLLGDIVENRDEGELRGHVTRVSEFALYLARKLNYSEDEMAILRDAVPMHDIGKIGIYDSILMKPGPLTPEEFEIMKEHSEIGFEILRHSTRKLFRMAAIIAREHHERWDGKGYPRGLSGEDIHQFGRITFIADVFDALSSDRIYRKAWDFEKTMNFIRDGRGTQFDPELVDLFLEDPDQIRNIVARHAGGREL